MNAFASLSFLLHKNWIPLIFGHLAWRPRNKEFQTGSFAPGSHDLHFFGISWHIAEAVFRLTLALCQIKAASHSLLWHCNNTMRILTLLSWNAGLSRKRLIWQCVGQSATNYVHAHIPGMIFCKINVAALKFNLPLSRQRLKPLLLWQL